MFISNRYSATIVRRLGGLYIERVFINHSAWWTGGHGLHTLHKYTVFSQCGMFYHCLGYRIIWRIVVYSATCGDIF